ncbi:hypothetical protein GCM10009555_047640 [Acrocarpospora macrocephala]|uniref:Uncharacterized protein n=1 Tax=Acrocarpospora macrocephala TaxID=150177 RepID=A0A5M3WRZ3_9ACTN|nr:hypothetical protein [Acrocarpospora macrocephala]GES12105.1 hypothetical protein Amac_057020 [Acrocarpospora macrocephala]
MLVLVLALMAALVLPKSGLLGARFQTLMLEGSSGWSSGDTRTFSIRFGIRNDAWTSVTIVDAGRSSSFMRLLKIEETRMPITLEHGDTAYVEFVYQVTDCDNVPNEEWPIPVQVERPWGVQTEYVEPPPQDPNFSEDSPLNEDESITWQWHGARASYVCDWHL